MQISFYLLYAVAVGSADIKMTPACAATSTCGGFGVVFLGAFAGEEAFYGLKDDNTTTLEECPVGGPLSRATTRHLEERTNLGRDLGRVSDWPLSQEQRKLDGRVSALDSAECINCCYYPACKQCMCDVDARRQNYPNGKYPSGSISSKCKKTKDGWPLPHVKQDAAMYCNRIGPGGRFFPNKLDAKCMPRKNFGEVCAENWECLSFECTGFKWTGRSKVTRGKCGKPNAKWTKFHEISTAMVYSAKAIARHTFLGAVMLPVCEYVYARGKTLMKCLNTPDQSLDSKLDGTKITGVSCTKDLYSIAGAMGVNVDCKVPPIRAKVSFDPENAPDVALEFPGYTFNKELLPIAKKFWEKSPFKNFTTFAMESSIQFSENPKLSVKLKATKDVEKIITNFGSPLSVEFSVTIPGLQFSMNKFNVKFVIEKKWDHWCTDDDGNIKPGCKFYFTGDAAKRKRINLLTQPLGAVGPVPVVIAIDTGIYISVEPIFKIQASVTLDIKLTKPIDLTNTVTIGGLCKGKAIDKSLIDKEKFLDIPKLRKQIKENMQVKVMGDLKGTAIFKLCLGVEVAVGIDGAKIIVDVPYCFQAKFEFKAEISSSRKLIQGTLSYKGGFSMLPLAINVAVDLPDIAEGVDTICSLSKSAFQAATLFPILSVNGQQKHVTQCLNEFATNVCKDAKKVAAKISIQATKLEPAYELYSEWKLKEWSGECKVGKCTSTILQSVVAAPAGCSARSGTNRNACCGACAPNCPGHCGAGDCSCAKGSFYMPRDSGCTDKAHSKDQKTCCAACAPNCPGQCGAGDCSCAAGDFYAA